VTELPDLLQGKLSSAISKRLIRLRNPELNSFLSHVIGLCDPESVYIVEGSPLDREYVKRRALELGEEIQLKVEGHTVHFDPPWDQARSRDDTFILGDPLPFVNTRPREEGLREVMELMRGSMRGREMFVGFYSLGPRGSDFQVLAVQVTDSPYVIHTENVLYRGAYWDFVDGKGDFLRFVHSKGSMDPKRRRIAVDLWEETVYSVNTTYAGNSVGLKKLALRLTLRRAVREGWLSEHMAILGIQGRKGTHYVAAAFPSGSGKTSTAMVGGLVSDDLAFIREIGGQARGVNPEVGVFGILQGVNKRDDPVIWEVLSSPGEVIFSNVLVTEERGVYWVGNGSPEPERGINFSGQWWRGKRGENGTEVPASHPNARFTAPLSSFSNLDPKYDDPSGVEVEALIFGVKDYSTLPPVVEAFNWIHGVVTMGAAMESMRTSAVIGVGEEVEFNPMALLDFLSVNLGDYLRNYLDFGARLKIQPKVFGLNYFLKDDDGSFVSGREDKRVWLRWIAERIEGEAEGVRTPVGFIPSYQDLHRLFRELLREDYKRGDYVRQFALRLSRYKRKFERILSIYSCLPRVPEQVLRELEAQISRIASEMERHGESLRPP